MTPWILIRVPVMTLKLDVCFLWPFGDGVLFGCKRSESARSDYSILFPPLLNPPASTAGLAWFLYRFSPRLDRAFLGRAKTESKYCSPRILRIDFASRTSLFSITSWASLIWVHCLSVELIWWATSSWRLFRCSMVKSWFAWMLTFINGFRSSNPKVGVYYF